MAANLQAIAATGTLPLRDELLAKYGAGLLELLKLPGMGPKTVALLWDAAQIGSIDQLAEAIEAGRLAGLPRMGEKQIEKLRKGIEDYRRSAGPLPHRRGRRSSPADRGLPAGICTGIEKVTPAGSLRRGRETVGDLDLLVTGPACAPGAHGRSRGVRGRLSRHSRHHRQGRKQGELSPGHGLQVDVRLLPSASYGAALQYFTGSKAHNVALRQRALKMGYTLSEWALARLDDDSTVAAATEEEIYAALGMDWMPPEMRENLGEIESRRAPRAAPA